MRKLAIALLLTFLVMAVCAGAVLAAKEVKEPEPKLTEGVPLLALFYSSDTQNRAILTWKFEAGKNKVTGFTVERLSEPAGEWKALATVTTEELRYSDTVPENANSYRYRVFANGPAKSRLPNSNEVEFVTSPLAPTGLKVEAVSQTPKLVMRLTWTNNSKFVKTWYVHRWDKANSLDKILAVLDADPKASSAEYLDDSARPGEPFTYYVTACINFESWPSNKVTITPPGNKR